MSLENAPQEFAGSRSPRPAHPCPPQDNSRPISSPTPPSLLSVLSPRPSHEHTGPPLQQQTHKPPPPSFLPRVVETKHPLYLSEMDPSAPVQHIYHGPEGHSHVPQNRAEPLLVPIKPASRPLARPERVPIPPLATRRQSRKIGLRRDELEKGHVEINRSSSAEHDCSNEPERRGSPKDLSSLSRSERQQRSFEASTQLETSPHNTPSAAVPISNLLSRPR